MCWCNQTRIHTSHTNVLKLSQILINILIATQEQNLNILIIKNCNKWRKVFTLNLLSCPPAVPQSIVDFCCSVKNLSSHASYCQLSISPQPVINSQQLFNTFKQWKSAKLASSCLQSNKTCWFSRIFWVLDMFSARGGVLWLHRVTPHCLLWRSFLSWWRVMRNRRWFLWRHYNTDNAALHQPGETLLVCRFYDLNMTQKFIKKN